MDPQAASRRARDAGPLSPGTRLAGGRYTVGKRERHGLFADLYQAQDATIGASISIHVLDPRLVERREVVDRLADTVARAATLDHKNITKIVELAVEGEHTYLATEVLEGHSLRELLDRKRDTGTTGFGGKGALNIVTHVASAMSAAAPTVPRRRHRRERRGKPRRTHPGHRLRPGLARPDPRRPRHPGARLRAGGGHRQHADRGVGCVLPGRAPLRGPGGGAGNQGLHPAQPGGGRRLGRGQPHRGPRDVAQPGAPLPQRRRVIEAAAEALADSARQSGSQAAGSPSQVSVPAARPPSGVRPAGPPAPGESQPSLAEALAVAGPRNSGQVAVSTALTAASVAEREERWLVSKGKLDYGPFNLAQIAEQNPGRPEYLPGHVIIDKDSGGRCKVEQHPLLGRDGGDRQAPARRAPAGPRRGPARHPGEAARRDPLPPHRGRRPRPRRRRLRPGRQAARGRARRQRHAHLARGRVARGQDRASRARPSGRSAPGAARPRARAAAGPARPAPRAAGTTRSTWTCPATRTAAATG